MIKSSKNCYLGIKRAAVPRINESELTKLYYPIGEVARMLDVNASLIRFWETEFTGLIPKKNSKGNRLYSAKEIMRLDRIYHLVKEQGFTLDGARKVLKDKTVKSIEVEPETETIPDNHELINRLENVRVRLLKLKS